MEQLILQSETHPLRQLAFQTDLAMIRHYDAQIQTLETKLVSLAKEQAPREFTLLLLVLHDTQRNGSIKVACFHSTLLGWFSPSADNTALYSRCPGESVTHGDRAALGLPRVSIEKQEVFLHFPCTTVQVLSLSDNGAGEWDRTLVSKRSTKTTEKAKALQIALEFERVEKMAQAGTLTTAQVKKVLSEVSEKVIGDNIEIPTVEAYFKEWMVLVGRRTSPATVERYQNTIDLFAQKLGLRAKQPISTLTARHIEEFLEWRLKKGVAPKTAVVDLKTLSTALRRAETHQLIPKNPVPLVQLPKMVCSEREVFSEEEIQKLLDSAPDIEWQTIILLGYHAGMRLSDCVALKWENIDPELGAIVYTQKKTGKKLIVPIEPVLLKHLTYLAKFGTAGFISPKLATKGPGGKHGLSEGFKRIAIKAGVDLMSGPGKGVRNFCRRTFHSLRHTFISRLANLGVSQQLTMALAGHSTAAMNAKYTHFEFETLKKAISVLSTGKKPA